MQTYLPYPDFNKSAEVLDDKRLTRQRADVVAILKACSEPITEDEHPAIKMWRGNEPALIQYGIAICSEWQSRGNADATLTKIMEYLPHFMGASSKDMPEWLGREDIHTAHRSHLLRLKPSHYRQHFADSDDISMVWPRSPGKQKQTPEKRRLEKAHARWEKSQRAQLVARVDYLEVCAEQQVSPATMEPFASDEEREALVLELEAIAANV